MARASINGMVADLGERLLAAMDAPHAPPAAYLRQAERDNTPLTYADVTPARPAYTPPAPRRLVPGRARVELDRLMHAEFGLPLPASAHLRTVPLTVPPTAEETLTADAAAFVVARRDLDAIGETIRHADPQQAAAIRMALAPIAEQLAVTL